MSKILIVDDLPTEQQFLREVVSRLGHACVTASDGQQAVALAHQEKPNLILLDVVLPRLDGFQACRKIKQDLETAQIPIVLISMKSQESDEYWGLKQGASAYLRKPFNEEELAEVISKHLAA